MKNLFESPALRVGMNWGAIGGVAGFLSGLLGALSAMLIAGFIGYYCGKRASLAAEASIPGNGALSGLISGFVALPVFLVGAAVGAIVSARSIGMAQFARMISEMDVIGATVTQEEAWLYFLLSLVFAALAQTVVLVSLSTLGALLMARRQQTNDE